MTGNGQQLTLEQMLRRLDGFALLCRGQDQDMVQMVARLIRIQKQRIFELEARLALNTLERQRAREIQFGDIYHIPFWRLCAVQGCPEVLRRPVFICARHAAMPFDGGSGVTYG